MSASTTLAQASALYAGHFLFTLARYGLFAGVAYFIFWRWRKDRWQSRRVQQKFPDDKHLHTEVKYSLLTCLIFAAVGVGIFVARQAGYTRIYTNLADHSWAYFTFSILATIVAHDAYFYWTHRFMHLPQVFKYVHRVHHLSHNPSPWAAFSFHPLEAVIEAGIVPLMVCLMPMHPLAIAVFMMYMMGMNVLGHLGYEPYPAGFLRTRFGRLHNTSTHHNMHHQYVKGNYGLYFNVWDRLMSTNHAKYEERFEAVTEGKKVQKVAKKAA
ncbi:sterol desaturase family protein [Hymenobacter crusticola]|uniref:Fatty acid hydroxylase domain-containing protein n=1 Tax=Hymenobacter crusticola TaxID=1770526 RepID=A0A243WA84_9BACT|nr:sterol desaturase family protein [Hymenobacter crusticola]OUJ72279.1 hypothetical protein BXP70_18635 [Hymenobacter crusticola]